MRQATSASTSEVPVPRPRRLGRHGGQLERVAVDAIGQQAGPIVGNEAEPGTKDIDDLAAASLAAPAQVLVEEPGRPALVGGRVVRTDNAGH